jgi:hypothetical protein
VLYDAEALHTLTIASKRERVQQLDIATASFELEQTLRDQGQQIITRYFILTTLAAEGIIRTGD